MSRQLKRKEARLNKPAERESYLLHYIFLAFTIVLLPLIYYKPALDIVLMPRVFAISAFLLVFSIFFIAFMKSSANKLTVLRHRIFWVMALWLIVSLVSVFLASNPIEGIYDIIKVAFTITIAFYASILFISKDNWFDDVVKAVVIAAILTSIVGFVQYYMWVLSSESGYLPDGRRIVYRVVGIMAHKNLYSLSLFMMLPFAAYGAYAFRKYWRYAAIVAMVFTLTIIVLLQTRATWVGLMFAIAAVILILAFLGNRFNISRKLRIGLFSLSVIGALGFSGIVFILQSESQNQYVKQLQSIVDLKSPHNMHRVNIWSATTEMIAVKPLFGFGPSNWKLHIGNYYKGRFVLEEQTNWQRPHNDFLWVLAEKGFIGFALYLLIFGLSFYYLIQAIKHHKELKLRFFALALFAVLVGYLAASAFDFPYERVFHQAFLGIVFACSIALYHSLDGYVPLVFNRFILLLPLIVVFGFSTSFGYNVTKQEAFSRKARNEIEIINRGILPRLSSLPPDQLKNAQILLQAKWKEMLKYAQLAQYKYKNLDPQANPISYYIALAYINLGDMQNGLKYCLQALDENPGSIKALNSIGAVYYNLKQYQKAKDYLLKSHKIVPSHDALQNLSAVYYMLGEYEKAYELLNNAPKNLMTPSLENNKKAIELMLKADKE